MSILYFDTKFINLRPTKAEICFILLVSCMIVLNVQLDYLPILQYDATLFGSKDKCKKMKEVPRLNLRDFLFFKKLLYLV